MKTRKKGVDDSEKDIPHVMISAVVSACNFTVKSFMHAIKEIGIYLTRYTYTCGEGEVFIILPAPLFDVTPPPPRNPWNLRDIVLKKSTEVQTLRISGSKSSKLANCITIQDMQLAS